MPPMQTKDHLSKVESRISLGQQAVGGVGWALSYFGLWPYLIAAGVAVFAALYKVLGWVGQYGWAGWFLLALASVVVIALVAGTVFAALVRYEAYRQSKSINPNPAQLDQNIGQVFEAATGIGELRSQFDIFEEHTRSALSSIQFKMDIYNRAVGNISDSYSSLRLLRKADKANGDLELARTFMNKIADGEWTTWEQWRSAKQKIEGYLRSYSHTMRNFINAEGEIFTVSAYQFAPGWLGDRKPQFPDDQIRHEFLTLYAYLFNARETHMRLVSRFNSRIVPDTVTS
ncbi:hypothetical protein [Mesorhizobium sp. M0243]|uniref:hypothetical protein n=1 Tax=Mesorhizobium sp. M0243 TaxID=2956925 RepID=UPI00333C1704